MDNIRERATEALAEFIGKGHDFREGQLEAIEAALTHKRTLVVQRTGWGKSMVYFICTKLLRDEGEGMTIVVSPLLALMANQMAAAQKAGLECALLKGASTKEEKEYKQSMLNKMLEGELDMVFTTPETLKSSVLPLIKDKEKDTKRSIGLLVIDEVHCISDWGHDFRLEYRELRKVIEELDSVPILATTATANEDVIEDLNEQLGGKEPLYTVPVRPGSLLRDNLYIQTLKLHTREERYAWILDNLPKLTEKGSGIIYCLTQRDCDELASFLKEQFFKARSYHSGIKNYKPEDLDIPIHEVSDEVRENIYDKRSEEEIADLFMDNEIDILVATTKLGMGYDKENISFVIHYQTPAGIVAYYQQIGRAGRNGELAYTFLMNGKEDADIQEFFRDTAFPKEEESRIIYNEIKNSPKITATSKKDFINNLERSKNIDMDRKRIENTLKFLEHEGFIVFKDDNNYHPNSEKAYDPDRDYNRKHYDEITKRRELEYDKMTELMDTDQCYNRFIVNVLDDKTAETCGVCANCRPADAFPEEVSQKSLEAAKEFTENYCPKIRPRAEWAGAVSADQEKVRMPETRRNRFGISLSWFGKPPYGDLVRKEMNGSRFGDVFVEKSAGKLAAFIREKKITAVTYVPSRRGIVKDFAERLAARLGLPCLTLLERADIQNLSRQCECKNDAHKCRNARNSFLLAQGAKPPQDILLVDDLVDSRWTMTACGFILTGAGAKNVYPFALASKRAKVEEN